MSPLPRVAKEQVGDVSLAALEGEMDVANATELGDVLRGLMTNAGVALVIDLSSITYLDSAGLNLLFTLDRELRDRQQELRLVVPEGSPLTRTLEITGLAQAIRTEPDRDSALKPALAG